MTYFQNVDFLPLPIDIKQHSVIAYAQSVFRKRMILQLLQLRDIGKFLQLLNSFLDAGKLLRGDFFQVFEDAFSVDDFKHSSASTSLHATKFRRIGLPSVCQRLLLSIADILTCSAAGG